jgi:hypothetical protein
MNGCRRVLRCFILAGRWHPIGNGNHGERGLVPPVDQIAVVELVPECHGSSPLFCRGQWQSAGARKTQVIAEDARSFARHGGAI